MKKKICIITSSFPIDKKDNSSAGVFVRDFALLLANENFDVFVLAPQKNGSKYYDDRISINFFPWLGGKVGLSSYNPKNPIQFFKLVNVVMSGIWSTIKFVKKNDIDICLAMWAVPSGIFALAAKILLKKPYVVWSLGSDILKIQDYPLGKVILKKVLKNSQKLFADGLHLAKAVENISERKCDFLPSGRILNMEIHEVDYVRFDPTKTNFMFLGRYHQTKGIDLLIESIALLSREEKEKILFHIFGGGPLESIIKKKVKELNLEFNTFVNSYLEGNQIFSYMSKSDFVVIPSRSESIPLVLSEAIQTRKPLVLTNVGDMGSLATKYKIGFVIEPNSKSLAEGLRLAIKSDQKERKSFLLGMKDLENYLDVRKSVKTIAESIN